MPVLIMPENETENSNLNTLLECLNLSQAFFVIASNVVSVTEVISGITVGAIIGE